MLMELIREESDISRAAIQRSRTPSKKEEALDEGIVGVQMMDNRDASKVNTSMNKEGTEDDVQSVDEADIYKSSIDEGVSYYVLFLSSLRAEPQMVLLFLTLLFSPLLHPIINTTGRCSGIASYDAKEANGSRRIRPWQRRGIPKPAQYRR